MINIAPFARTGRPKTEDPRNKNLTVRINKETETFLNEYSKEEKVSKSETVHRGLKSLKDNWKNKK